MSVLIFFLGVYLPLVNEVYTYNYKNYYSDNEFYCSILFNQVNHEAPSQVDTQEDHKLNDTHKMLPSPPLGSATALDPDVEVIKTADMEDQPVLARQIERRPGDPRTRLMGPR